MSAAKHTPGPWLLKTHKSFGGTVDVIDRLVDANDRTIRFDGVALSSGDECEANTRLIAAAPDYHDATFWILQAVSNNAAPINPLAALEEMALDGEHITLDAGLVLDLLKAHVKATGGAS